LAVREYLLELGCFSGFGFESNDIQCCVLPKSRREDCAILSPDIQKGSPAGAEACNEPVCDDVICPKSGLLGIAKLHGSEREILLDSQQGLPERRTESSTFQRISHQQNPEFHLCSRNRPG
jgi:hypothetical protein